MVPMEREVLWNIDVYTNMYVKGKLGKRSVLLVSLAVMIAHIFLRNVISLDAAMQNVFVNLM